MLSTNLYQGNLGNFVCFCSGATFSSVQSLLLVLYAILTGPYMILGLNTDSFHTILSLWKAEENLTATQSQRYHENKADVKMLSLESGVMWPQAKDSIIGWKNSPLELWRECGSDNILILTP